MKYAKFKNKYEIEPAPKTKGSISNYDTDIEQMSANGYLPVVAEDKPEGNYQEVYELQENQIMQTWEKIVLDVEYVRELKLQEFYKHDETYRKTGFIEYQGKFFSISQDAKINLMAVINQASLFGGKITYFEKTGKMEVYTLEEFKPVAAAISQGITEAETNFYITEAKIKSASYEELESMSWS